MWKFCTRKLHRHWHRQDTEKKEKRDGRAKGRIKFLFSARQSCSLQRKQRGSIQDCSLWAHKKGTIFQWSMNVLLEEQQEQQNLLSKSYWKRKLLAREWTFGNTQHWRKTSSQNTYFPVNPSESFSKVDGIEKRNGTAVFLRGWSVQIFNKTKKEEKWELNKLTSLSRSEAPAAVN